MAHIFAGNHGVRRSSSSWSRGGGAEQEGTASNTPQHSFGRKKNDAGEDIPRSHTFLGKLAPTKPKFGSTLSKKERFQRICRYINVTLEDPQFSVIARVINIFVLFLILFSTTTFLIQTLPELDPKAQSDPEYADYLENLWNQCETVVVAIFTAEYMARALTCPNFKKFVTDGLNIVDVLAIFPYYLDLVVTAIGSADGVNVSQLRFLRTIRLFRVFRLFKLSKHSLHFVVFVETLRKSRDALLMLTFILALTVIVFGGIMHILEKADYDPETGLYTRGDNSTVHYDPFVSVPAACYWGITTLTTVGYGDAVPVSPLGKTIAPIAMLAGILTIAMPLGVIGENLIETYRKNAKVSNAVIGGDAAPPAVNNLEDMVQLVSVTRQEIAFLFVSIENTILRLRAPPTARQGHAFNNVEQVLFDNVVNGLQALETHLKLINNEMTGESSSGLRDYGISSQSLSTTPRS